MTTATIDFKRPHTTAQHTMIADPSNIVALCGRRFGKTDAYVQRLYYWMQRRPGLYWWVGLSWRSASLKRAWREVTAIARQIYRAIGAPDRGLINKSNYEITIPGMGDIWFRTAENAASLAGEAVRGVVLDEFTLMASDVWYEYIQATLLDYKGWAAFGGVPKGPNWGADLWRAAATRDGWRQVHATTYDNPFIDNAEIDALKGQTTERFFNQEYLAQIVDDAGAVFRRVVEAATAVPQDKPIPGHAYAFGLDWAKQDDFTSIAIIDLTLSSLVNIDRFNQIDYVFQSQRVKAAYERWRPGVIIAEKNSIGDPVIEALHRMNLPVQPFTTTNATKAAAIEALALAFESSQITIVNDPDLIGELQSMTLSRTVTGLPKYGAPAGYHDDMVIALALAWQAAVNTRPAFL